MKKMRIRWTFTDGILGSTPNNRNLYETYLGQNAPTAEGLNEEIEAIPVIEQEDGTIVEALGVGLDAKGITIFPRDENGNPIMWDYQIKGFFKEKCSFLKKVAGSVSSKITAHKKKIDGNIFIMDRENLFVLPEDGEITLCQRPLRAETAQGPRVALSCSEEIPEGSYIEFTVIVQNDGDLEAVKEWCNDGVLHGTGQWRNSGKGRFVAQFGKPQPATTEEFIEAKMRMLGLTSQDLDEEAS